MPSTSKRRSGLTKQVRLDGTTFSLSINRLMVE
jgi:hypothetical protein